jgi:transcription-repair coupling factor (superfamily II helicase)
LAQALQVPAAGGLFARVAETPAVQSLARRLESGGALSCVGIPVAAQPFFAALLRELFPGRPIVVVTDNLKTQEFFQQDLETWVRFEFSTQVPPTAPSSILHPPSSPFFFPAWEVLPHEARLPHADVISDRLQTLVALAANSEPGTRNAELIVTNVIALLQKTFPPEELTQRTRTLQRGDRANPLDLIEWLEEQGYEAEAQVTQKGEIAMRGGNARGISRAEPEIEQRREREEGDERQQQP